MLVDFFLQKDNQTDHLRNGENFRTTKSIIDNAQLSSNRYIGMNPRHMDHVNTCIPWLHTFIKDITQKTPMTFGLMVKSKSYKRKRHGYYIPSLKR